MSTTTNLFKINGFIDTRNNVWDNIEKISSAASAWTTYDTTTGKWSLVINREETPVKTFDDSNIIGDITLTKSPLSSAYTGGKFKYANRDIPGAFDSIEYFFDEINTGNFADYDYRGTDLENKIEITNELVNEYVQADVLLNRELKQSRRRTNIEFYTDFGALDLLAGDVINVTSDLFYDDQTSSNTTRKFRVIEIEETDGDGGEILLKVIGVEYLDEDYELFGFERFTRETADPMPPIKANETIQDDIKLGNTKNIIEPVFEDGSVANEQLKENTNIIPELLVRGFTITGPSSAYEGQTVTYNFASPSDSCTSSTFTVPYTITGVSAADLNTPLTGTITISNGTGSLDVDLTSDNLTEGDETLTLTVGCKSISTTIIDQSQSNTVYTLTSSSSSVGEDESLTFTLAVTNTANGTNIPYVITGIDSSDLATGSLTGNFNANWADGETGDITLTFTKGALEGTETINMNVNSGAAIANVNLTDKVTASFSASPQTITEGETTTVYLTVDGVADGTSIPYTITGSASGKVISPALTGNVTLSSGVGALTISTSDDGVDDGYQTLLNIAYVGSGVNIAGGVFVLDNDGTGNNIGGPGSTPIATSVPLVWRATYDKDSDEVTALSPVSYVQVYTSPAVGTAVTIPTAVSITSGNPTTVTVTSSITAYTGTNVAGHPYEFITTFDNITPGNPVTGTTTTVRGY